MTLYSKRTKKRRRKPMFYSTVIEPFLSPFREWFGPKFVIFFTAVVAQATGFLELFEVPSNYVYLLVLLIGCDAAAKVVRILFVNPSKWDGDLLIRKTLYKFTSYSIILVAFTAFSNQYETDADLLKYGAFVGLSALELISIAGHFKLIGYMMAFTKQVFTGKIDFEELKREAEKHAVKSRKDFDDE